MSTFATLFSGGELAGVGLQVAGLKHLWGVEYDSDIASVAETNGFSAIVADVREVDYSTLEAPYWLHASPVCVNASVAKAGGQEEQTDIETAGAVVRAIEVLDPAIVSIENVWGYRKFEAFKLILRGLAENGYYADYWHLNSADYAVPQTRKRLILIARKDRYPQKPRATHHDPSGVEEGQLSLFAPSTQPWIGWYEAIEDLIDTLPESEFAPWQLERLPMGLLMEYGNALVQRHPNARGDGVYPMERPAKTVEATGTAPRAFVIGSTVAAPVAQEQQPLPTLTTDNASRFRAFLVNQDSKMGMVNGETPSFTVTSNPNRENIRAFVMPGANSSNENYWRYENEPMVAISGHKSAPHARAWLQQGRIVKMTPRALARLQSVPDWYQLSGKASLDCQVIGNGVPSLLMQCIAESQLPAELRGAA